MATRRSAADRGSDDLFSAAVGGPPAPAVAAGRAPPTPHPGRDRRPGAPGRPGPAVARPGRGRSPLLGHLLGASGHGQDDVRPGRRRDHRGAFEQLSAVTAGGEGRARGDRARPRTGSASTGRARSCSSTRSTASTRPSRTRCCPAVEDGTLTLIGATTENPFFEVNPPLRSRSTLFRLEPLGRDALRRWLERGLEAEGATAEPTRSTGWSTAPAATVARCSRRSRSRSRSTRRGRPAVVDADDVEAASGRAPCATAATTTTT